MTAAAEYTTDGDPGKVFHALRFLTSDDPSETTELVETLIDWIHSEPFRADAGSSYNMDAQTRTLTLPVVGGTGEVHHGDWIVQREDAQLFVLSDEVFGDRFEQVAA